MLYAVRQLTAAAMAEADDFKPIAPNLVRMLYAFIGFIIIVHHIV
jgi:hypothetical protein